MVFSKESTVPVVAAALVGAFALAAAAGGSEPVSEPLPPVAAYRLGPGDRVEIAVVGAARLSGTFEVATDRTVVLPRVGAVEAAGLTLRELEARLEHRLKGRLVHKPRVRVRVAAYRPFFVIGEVQRPGSYAYLGRITVLNAVALGGGFTHRARRSRMFLTRAADPERKERAVTPDAIVMPGDVIRVPERYF